MTMPAPSSAAASDAQAALPQLMTTAEVAGILRSCEKTILRRIKSGKLPAIREGGRWLIKADDVRVLLIQGMTRHKRQVPDVS